MNPFDQSVPRYLENRALLLLLVSVSLALGWILLPFYSAILWGAIIALLFEPVHRRLLQRLNQRRTPAGPTIAAMFIAAWHIYLRMRPDAVP
jgi:predicted PurR-regulated permease PerM